VVDPEAFVDPISSFWGHFVAPCAPSFLGIPALVGSSPFPPYLHPTPPDSPFLLFTSHGCLLHGNASGSRLGAGLGLGTDSEVAGSQATRGHATSRLLVQLRRLP